MQLEKFEKLKPVKKDAILNAGIREFSIKSYADAGTDAIAKSCGISKGLLFHYFGSKKDFYLYCLSLSLKRLIRKEDMPLPQGCFYELLFSFMDRKLALCAQYPWETKFVNMASRETSAEVAKDKALLFAQYAAQTHKASAAAIKLALAALPLKPRYAEKAQEGLLLYSTAIINKYLLTYQKEPEAFFQNAPQIQTEIKEYLDLMLYGLVPEQEKMQSAAIAAEQEKGWRN